MTIRILLADDHQIVLDGLRALLEQQPDMTVIAAVSDGHQAVQVSQRLQPHLVIMDVSMPGLNGVEATRQLKADWPTLKVLCLSMHADKRFVRGVLDAEASGYLLKEAAGEELVRAIHIVLADQIYLSPAIASVVVADYEALRSDLPPSVLMQLTAREREILQLIAEGHDTKAIAAHLHLSIKTIGTHREHLMAKLHTHSVAGLTRYAIREGLTSTEG